jgi:hypothetical protein
MKVGDLVKCIWQPTTSHIENDCAVPMKRHIKGEFGIIVRHKGHRYDIIFPQLDGYTHWLSTNAFEVIQ